MQSLRRKLFTGSAFSNDERRPVNGSEFRDVIQRLCQRSRFTDDRWGLGFHRLTIPLLKV